MTDRHGTSLDRRLARTIVIGTGRRRAMLLALFAVPVLLATAAASVVDTLNLSPAQLATTAMAQADTQIDRIEPGPAPADLAAVLGPLPPGTAAVPYYRSPQFPVVVGGLTVQAAYRETDWTAPVTHGWLRTTAGRLPAGPAEAAVSRHLAATRHLRIGDELRHRWSDTPATIVGVVEDPSAYRADIAVGGPGLFARWFNPAHAAESGAVRGWLVTGGTAALGPPAARQHLAVRTRTQVASTARSLLAAQPGLVAVPGLLLVLCAAAAVFGLRMRRLQRQFALLSAIGFDGPRLVRVARTAGLLAAAAGGTAGVVLGTALGAAVRPAVRSAVARDLAAVDPATPRPLVLLLATVLCGALAVRIPARLAAARTVRSGLNRAPATRAGTRRRRWCAILGAVGAAAVVSGVAAGSSTPGAAGGVVLLAALLLAVPDVLILLGRAAGPLRPGPRFAVRDLARDRRRPTAAVAFGTVAVALATATALFVGGNSARDAREYAGSRHTGQVEVVLRDAPPSAAVEDALRTAAGTTRPVVAVQGVYASDTPEAGALSRLALPPVAILAPGGVTGSRFGRLQIVDTPDDFRALTMRGPTGAETAALTAGHVLALDPVFVRGGAVDLAAGPEQAATPRRVPAAVAEHPVDSTTLNRARAVLTARAARALGLVPVTTTYLATLDGAVPPDLEARLGRALEPLGVPATALHVERPYSPPVPVRWNVLMAVAGVMVLVVTLLAVSASAQELRPQLRLLRVIGFGGPTRRTVSATQAAVITALSVGCGATAGFVLAGAQLWPKGTEIVVPWTLLAGSCAAVVAGASAAGFLLHPVTARRAGRRPGRARAAVPRRAHRRT
ncbi:hypothetical protein KNE206_02080 [Kitasatospora sp. NE20-6]|uniref:hypothetical protein n=1 Tax=Kitasatospora sp. NE20-6 TaxID=2859066 RepID=UPI0034DC71FE